LSVVVASVRWVTWTRTTSGHEIGLIEGRIRCRNAAGKVLRSLPAALKDDPAVVQLKQVLEWLTRHEASGQATIEIWMARSLPVPLSVLVRIWRDPSWQRSLRDLAVRPAFGVPGEGELGPPDPVERAR
jgi:hypothetical protein